MKKFVKNNLKVIIAFTLGLVIAGGVSAFATNDLLASRKITYNDRRVDGALNELYQKARNININGNRVCKLIDETYGSHLNIGAKYECEVGNNIKENFYILKKSGNIVDLIMEKNLSDTVGTKRTMSWNDALTFFTTGAGVSTKNAWVNVLNIDLPNAQDLSDAGDILSWNVRTSTDWSFFGVHSQSDTSKRANYAWLFNYTRGCTGAGCSNSYTVNDANYADGYWSKDIVYNSGNGVAWAVNKNGHIYPDVVGDNAPLGVRPVITLYAPSLYAE